MMSISWKSAAAWGLVGLMFLLYWLVLGPVPALAAPAPYDAVLYEVTEDMYLKDSAGKFVTSPLADGRRVAVARLAGWAKLGTPLCPAWVAYVVPGIKKCNVNATGADDLSLATRKGTLAGAYTVTVQDDNKVDSPEFVVMSGTFKGDADLSPVAVGKPIGFITNGVAAVDGSSPSLFAFKGTFRLPFTMDVWGKRGGPRRNHGAYYLGNDGLPFRVRMNEKSLGFPTVRIDIVFDGAITQDPSDDTDDTND